MLDRALTVVVPVFNEVGSLEPLYDGLVSVLRTLRTPYEIVFVNDGSTDGSTEALDDIAARDPKVHVLHFRRNYGKSAALDAGFRHASGGIVITIDGDLQNEPSEIPRFIEKIERGADMVCGWRRYRGCSASRIISSAVFNAVMRRVSDAPFHDFNCGFKAYRAECLAGLHLYGGLHRFIPVLLSWRGFTGDEVEISDRKRWSGESKYSAWRIPAAALDLLTIILIGKFRSRPLHFFGLMAVPAAFVGIALLICILVLSVLQIAPAAPSLMIWAAAILVVSSATLFGIGLIGELVKSMLSSAEPDYLIRNTTQVGQIEIVDSADTKRRRSR
jgi:glycosyltransferase involved in cell wall biosynthesis